MILLTNNTNDEIDEDFSEDDDSNSDSDYCFSGTESDDTSGDEHISQEDDSSDSYVSNHDINVDKQPDTIEKGGIVWSTQKIPSSGRLRATNILKKKSSIVGNFQTITDAFKLFITNDI
jgi:hypothetical protein